MFSFDNSAKDGHKISLKDLIDSGACFEINGNHNLEDDSDLFPELMDDTENAEKETDDEGNILSPWNNSFDELKQKMVKVSDFLYKRVVTKSNQEDIDLPLKARFKLHYSGFWENEKVSFDSTYFRRQPLIFNSGIDEGAVLPGIESAVRTMKKNEESQFIISHLLLFGEQGFPPRIKKKADGLFIIKLIDVTEIADPNIIKSFSEEEDLDFSATMKIVKELHLNGLDNYKRKNYKIATDMFAKGVRMLEFCHLNDSQEQTEQNSNLIKLYTNLMTCYNKLERPAKVCQMFNKLKRISYILSNVKALYHNGRALLALGDFTEAKTHLLNAQRIAPNNEEIIKELQLLEQKCNKYKEEVRVMWERAFQLVNNRQKSSINTDVDEHFLKEMRKYIENINIDEHNGKIPLPECLTSGELSAIKDITNELSLTLQIHTINDQETYSIIKPKSIK